MPQTMTLATVGEGALEELFQNALARVLANIDDPNTAAKAKRSLTLTLAFEVDENRRSSTVRLHVGTKLAGSVPHTVHVRIGQHEGELAAVEAMPQSEMFPQPHGVPRAVEGV